MKSDIAEKKRFAEHLEKENNKRKNSKPFNVDDNQKENLRRYEKSQRQ